MKPLQPSNVVIFKIVIGKMKPWVATEQSCNFLKCLKQGWAPTKNLGFKIHPPQKTWSENSATLQ